MGGTSGPGLGFLECAPHVVPQSPADVGSTECMSGAIAFALNLAAAHEGCVVRCDCYLPHAQVMCECRCVACVLTPAMLPTALLTVSLPWLPSLLQGVSIHPTTALLMAGVLLSGYSAYLSYTYLVKVKGEGLDIIQGWGQLKAFNEHLLVNFAGAAAAVLALQAEVGTMMMGGITKSAGPLSLAALAQVTHLLLCQYSSNLQGDGHVQSHLYTPHCCVLHCGLHCKP